MEKQKRIYYIDVIRVIACLSVIMIHSSGEYVIKEFGSTNFWIGNILDGFSRIGVPLFVMISGAIMLNKDYNCNRESITRHIKKLLLLFIFWSLLYSVIYNIIYPYFIEKEPISIFNFFKDFISGHYHLWFIYMIIGLYLITPLLRLWVNESNKKYVEYFLLLAMIFAFLVPQVINILNYYNDKCYFLKEIIDNKIQMKYIGGFTLYFVLGWYLNNYNIKNKRLLYILGILGACVSVIGTGVLSIRFGKPIQMYDDLSVNVLLESIAVFVFIKSLLLNANNKSKIVKTISKHSLGIYVIHPLIVSILYKMVPKTNISFALIVIPIVFIISFTISYVFSNLLSKIKILKSFV